MSLSKKDFYFITNRSSLFRYFVDNTSGTPHKYLYYPQKYELMTVTQINKYERNLTLKFLWWAIRNQHKMVPLDYKICTAKIFDLGVILLGTLLLARFSRKFFFRQEIIGLQNFMETRNMDPKFWKASVAYAGSFCLGYWEMKSALRQTYLSDLAIQYSPNFTNANELAMREIQPVMNKFYASRFPWLSQSTQI